jgi:DNA-binding GntR family transcriptional regulator
MNMAVKAALDLVRHTARRETRSAASRIYEDLRQRILSLELPPGSNLLRAELADHYEVSVTPLRDALQLLEQDGLVEIFPQSRTQVTRIDLPKVQEAHLLRVALETEVVRRLAERDSADTVAHCRAVIELQRSIADDRSQLQLFHQLDEYFHGSLFAALDLEDLQKIVRSRAGHLDRVRRLQTHSDGKILSIIEGHVAMIDAIEARSPEAAMSAVRAHLFKAPDWTDMFRAQHREYFT